MYSEKQLPSINNVKELKKFFHASLDSIFEENIEIQSQYKAREISLTLQNAMRNGEYVETYVRNHNSSKVPSGDTVYRKLHESLNFEKIDSLIDDSVKIAKSLGMFNGKVNVAIDEHDDPYYGRDNKYLINVSRNKFRGTDKVIRIASIDVVVNDERFTLGFIPKYPLDGIDKAKEVDILLRKVIAHGIDINYVLIDRGYFDAGVLEKIGDLGLKYIIPAKENPKTRMFSGYQLKWSEMNHCYYVVIEDKIKRGKMVVKTNYVRIRYKKDVEWNEFSFYTNAEVTENNVLELAETYRKRWGIETGYSKKNEIRLKTRTGNIKLRYFLYGLSILIYNFWILINMVLKNMKMRMPLKDFLYFLTKYTKLEKVDYNMLWKKVQEGPPSG